MDFRTFCDNDGCRKEMRPVVDKKTKEVFCTECGKTINSVSVFMKNQLIAFGQVRKDDKKQVPWAVRCHECKKEGPPVLDKSGKELICSFCGCKLTKLSRPFAQVIRENLQAQRRAEGG